MRTTMSVTFHDVNNGAVPANPISSLRNPTREFLDTNYKKTDLQKYCREIGISRVWTTKAELIEIIMARHSSPESPPASEYNHEEIDHQNIVQVLKELRERENVKDLQIEELNEVLKAAHVTINKLSDRLSSLEEQVRALQCSSDSTARSTHPSPLDIIAPPSQQQPEGTLLLGDDNFSQVRTSDLDEKCYIRTIRGANTDLTRCWVNEKLSWNPKSCILYCGYRDICEGILTEEIFDRLGSLITCLKQRNENMEIYLCELVPSIRDQTLDEKVNNFNSRLPEWCHSIMVS